jgi:hypothetical protein
MTTVEPREDRAEILRLLRAYHAAMVEVRTDDLDALLDADFTLVHMSGYVQPKDEWFDVIRSGQFDYRRIEVDETTICVRVDGRAAELTGRGIFNATINGMKSPWTMRFSMRFAKRDHGWIIICARYTSA